ncbi:amidohydrolase family protein [Actinomycetospora straminea]|uniref:Amidohydrolase family protein n=1 Tax=Actinomycetospora straminea TaxID=663607 RepID=A0ABP9E5H0_9PSEU|nr:amidohydrolase family protein [Actinomycetospora straminea]MDD7932700.1 amidohydrolase family protein [Actinomycetospora straminea]
MAARDTYLLTDVRTRHHDGPVDVAVTDGRIGAVGPGLEHPGPVLDGHGRVVLPGLVEPHLHLDKAMLGAEVVGSLDDAVARTAERKQTFTAEDVRARATDLLTRAHAAGVTRVRTPVDVDPTVGLTSLDVLLELRDAWRGAVDLQVVAFPQEGIAARPGTRDLLLEALARGADVLGACSYAEDDVDACREHVRDVLALAERHGVPVDVHADFAAGAGGGATDPRHDLAAEIAAMTSAAGLGGRVVLGHVTTLAGLDPDRRRRTADALAAASVGVAVLPPTDLYLVGASAPVRELRDAGVRVACSSNNVRNAFTPFGTGDPLDAALTLGHMQGVELDTLLDMVTGDAAALIGDGVHDGVHDVVPGARADLVLLDAPDAATGLLDRAPRTHVADLETVRTGSSRA